MAKKVRSLTVENLTRPATLVSGGRIADNFYTRLRGLIGVHALEQGDGMWIKPCTSIHCMFMSIPIDVIYLDKAQRVVGVDQEVRPWRMGHFYRKVHSVVELPAGAIARSAVSTGDQLAIRVT